MTTDVKKAGKRKVLGSKAMKETRGGGGGRFEPLMRGVAQNIPGAKPGRGGRLGGAVSG